jgi:hypothetical protein
VSPSGSRLLILPPFSHDGDLRAASAAAHHRTGRNVQFNVKASQEAIDAFYRISDAQNWVLGETLERALAALERELAGRS